MHEHILKNQLFRSYEGSNDEILHKAKYVYMCVFQVSALKKLGIVGRHYHFILSKCFI